MFYNGISCGFNNLVWVTNFGFPSVKTLLRGASPTLWVLDLEIGEMFLNFMLYLDA